MKSNFAIIFLVVMSTIANAQFDPGSSFINGGFYSFFDNSRNKQSDFSSGGYRHNIDISFGKFKKENKARGWNISNSILIQTFKSDSINPESTREFKLGLNRFWEFYKPLNDKLSLYMSPSVGLTYAKSYDYSISGYDFSFESWSREISMGASIKLGICWKVDKKWAFYGNLGIIDPIHFTGGVVKTEKYWEKNTNGDNTRSKGIYSNQYFVPGLASLGLGLGVRYFW